MTNKNFITRPKPKNKLKPNTPNNNSGILRDAPDTLNEFLIFKPQKNTCKKTLILLRCQISKNILPILKINITFRFLSNYFHEIKKLMGIVRVFISNKFIYKYMKNLI